MLIFEGDTAKNMRMTADHFGDDPLEHIFGCEMLAFGKYGDQHGEDKKNIADFLADLLLTTVIDRLGQLLAFLQKIFFQGGWSLFDIPGTSIFAAEGGDNLFQTGKGRGLFLVQGLIHHAVLPIFQKKQGLLYAAVFVLSGITEDCFQPVKQHPLFAVDNLQVLDSSGG